MTAPSYAWCEKANRRIRALHRRGEREAEEAELCAEISRSDFFDEAPPPCALGGETERRLDVPNGCAGMIIGKNGENIRNLEKLLKVSIRVESLEGDSAAKGAQRGVRPRDGPQQVVIKGTSRADVEAAVAELDVVVDVMEVAPEMAKFVVGRGGQHLKLIRELTGVAVLKLLGGPGKGEAAKEKEDGIASQAPRLGDQPDGASDDEDLAKSKPCWLQITGRRGSVVEAKMCLETHLGYYPVYEEMRAAERDLDQEIAEAQAALGRVSFRGRGRGRGEGRGRGAAGRRQIDNGRSVPFDVGKASDQDDSTNVEAEEGTGGGQQQLD